MLCLAPQWWNELPADVRTAESLTSLRKRLKTHLFRVHLDSTKPPPLPLTAPSPPMFSLKQTSYALLV